MSRQKAALPRRSITLTGRRLPSARGEGGGRRGADGPTTETGFVSAREARASNRYFSLSREERCVLKRGPGRDAAWQGDRGLLFVAPASGCYLSWIPVGARRVHLPATNLPPSRPFLSVVERHRTLETPRFPKLARPRFSGVIFNFLPD